MGVTTKWLRCDAKSLPTTSTNVQVWGAAPHLTSPHRTALHNTTPRHAMPHLTTPDHTTPDHITVHYTTPHHTTSMENRQKKRTTEPAYQYIVIGEAVERHTPVLCSKVACQWRGTSMRRCGRGRPSTSRTAGWVPHWRRSSRRGFGSRPGRVGGRARLPQPPHKAGGGVQARLFVFIFFAFFDFGKICFFHFWVFSSSPDFFLILLGLFLI